MKITRKMLATSMIAAAGATGVALGLSATAAASRRRPHRHQACPVCVPPAARNQSGRRDFAHAGVHVAARHRHHTGSSRRTRDASGRDSFGHPSAAPGSRSRRHSPAEHGRDDGRACDRAAEPADVGPGGLGVVDARRNTACRSAANSNRASRGRASRSRTRRRPHPAAAAPAPAAAPSAPVAPMLMPLSALP